MGNLSSLMPEGKKRRFIELVVRILQIDWKLGVMKNSFVVAECCWGLAALAHFTVLWNLYFGQSIQSDSDR